MRFDDLDIETLRIPTGRQKQSYTSARVKGLTLLLIRGCYVRYFDRAAFEQQVRVFGRRSRAAVRNLFAVTRLLLNWAVEHDRIHANPLAGRRALLHDIELRPRDCVLTSEELHRFVNELDAQSISRHAKVLLGLQLLVGTRAGELAGLLWSEVDFRARVARLPAERMKTKRDAEVVLSDAARRLLLEWRRKTLPLGRSRVFVEGLDIHALVREVRRLREWITFSSHDLRRTVRSQLQRLGCPLEIRSLISNHPPPSGVARHYDHATVRREQLRWLERWSAALVTVADDPEALTDELERADDALLEEFADVL